MAEQSLGFVGVGRMGSRMARRLLEAGHRVTIYDTNPETLPPLTERGARAATSPAEVASEAGIVFASLPGPSDVEAATLGPGGIREGTGVKIFVDMSTVGSTCARRVAAGLAAHGIVAVDAPVSGGIGGAERGTLAIMACCPEATRPALQPVLQILGKPFFVGTEPGQGQTMKLLNNLLSATLMAVSSEAMVLGVKAGLDPAQILDVINAGTGRNAATQDKFARYILPRTFDFGFAVGLLNKDVRLCLEEAEARGVPLVVGSAARQYLAVALATEGPDADITELVKTVERWAGVTVQGK